jgi:hypothetical protein
MKSDYRPKILVTALGFSCIAPSVAIIIHLIFHSSHFALISPRSRHRTRLIVMCSQSAQIWMELTRFHLTFILVSSSDLPIRLESL